MNIDGPDLVRALTAESERFRADRARYEQEAPHVTPGDARWALFVRPRAMIMSAQLSAFFRKQSLARPEWWATSSKVPISSDEVGQYLENFDMFCMAGFLQLFFSMVESNFRAIVRSLDSQACNEGTDDFKNVSDWLLARVAQRPAEAGALLDLLRNTRNTVHNHGHFVPPLKRRRNVVVDYRGKRYEFVVGKPVHFVGWPLLLDLVSDVRVLVNAVVRDQSVLALARVEEFPT